MAKPPTTWTLITGGSAAVPSVAWTRRTLPERLTGDDGDRPTHDVLRARVRGGECRYNVAPPPVPVLGRGGHVSLVQPSASQALSALARDAIDLFDARLVEGVGICAAEDCGRRQR